MNLDQYKVVSARRIATDNLVWQTPALASAAQGFLLSAALNPAGKGIFPLALALASTLVGLASIQLMIRHRRMEILDAELLRKFEQNQPHEHGYSIIPAQKVPEHPPATKFRDRIWVWLANTRSSLVWTWVLTGFVVLGFLATGRASIRLLHEISN
jgi:hypothetical protein